MTSQNCCWERPLINGDFVFVSAHFFPDVLLRVTVRKPKQKKKWFHDAIITAEIISISIGMPSGY